MRQSPISKPLARCQRRRRQGSDKRQRDAIEAFARRAGYELAGEFYDPAESGPDPMVSGPNPIETRPGFAELLSRIEGNGAFTTGNAIGMNRAVSLAARAAASNRSI